MQARALDSSLRVTSKCKFCYDFPTALVTNSLPSHPGLPIVGYFHKIASPRTKLTTSLLFWFELTNPALGWEPQSTLPTDPNKGMCPRSCLSLCLHPALTAAYGSLRLVWSTSSRICEWQTSLFQFLCGLLLNCGSQLTPPGLYLANANLASHNTPTGPKKDQ